MTLQKCFRSLWRLIAQLLRPVVSHNLLGSAKAVTQHGLILACQPLSSHYDLLRAASPLHSVRLLHLELACSRVTISFEES